MKEILDGFVAILVLWFKIVREQFRQVLAVVVVVIVDVVQEEDKPVAEVHTACFATLMSKKSKKRVAEKFRELNIHKRRKPIEAIAKELRPVIQGIINYYCKFSSGHTRDIWIPLNVRLLKWVKWEKGLYKRASLRWLKKKYNEAPLLFPHWQLVNP